MRAHVFYIAQRLLTIRRDFENALASSAAFGCWLSHPRVDHSFFFEPEQRRMNLVESHGAVRLFDDLMRDVHTIRLSLKPGNGEEYDLLKFTEICSFHSASN